MFILLQVTRVLANLNNGKVVFVMSRISLNKIFVLRFPSVFLLWCETAGITIYIVPQQSGHRARSTQQRMGNNLNIWPIYSSWATFPRSQTRGSVKWVMFRFRIPHIQEVLPNNTEIAPTITPNPTRRMKESCIRHKIVLCPVSCVCNAQPSPMHSE